MLFSGEGIFAAKYGDDTVSLRFVFVFCVGEREREREWL